MTSRSYNGRDAWRRCQPGAVSLRTRKYLFCEASIRVINFGGLVMALLAHWHRYSAEPWSNRAAFLVPM